MTSPAAQPPVEYVLGTGQDELTRLELQHRLNADLTHAAWRRAGVGPGTRVLDLGSGPGHATLDLAQLVTRDGKVVAADQSPGFIEYVRRTAEARGFQHVHTCETDAENFSEALRKHAPFDVVYVRWLFCFLPDPRRVLEQIRSVLRPGGRLLINDYFNWGSMSPAPRSAAVAKFIEASMASWRERGGDPDIVARLPALLAQTGFNLTHLEMHSRVARGGIGDPLLAWPLSWWRIYAPKLVGMDKLSQADCDRGLADLDALEKDPTQFFVCPPLFELLACTNP